MQGRQRRIAARASAAGLIGCGDWSDKETEWSSPFEWTMQPPTMQPQLTEQCVIHANAQFWGPMLAMKMEPVALREEVRFAPRHVVGSVALSGAWNGRIEVRLTHELARAATAAMLMLPAGEVVEADTLDAAREIANIIAGVIKSCLPRPCSMGLPQVALEAAEFTYRPEAENRVHVVFRHSAGEMMVRALEP